MTTYIIRRLLLMLLVLWGALTLLWVLFLGIPGSSIEARYSDRYLPEPIKKNFEAQYGLDKPLINQYATYWVNFAQGDLGESQTKSELVSTALGKAAKTSARLAFWGLVVQIFVGIPVGVYSALKRYSWFDSTTGFFAVAISAVPVFVTGILLQWVFGVLPGPNYFNFPKWARLPVQGFGDINPDGTWLAGVFPTGPTPRYVVLPAVVIAAVQTGYFVRLTRTSMLEVLRADYLRTAAAKGLSRRSIIFKHALRNALIPVITILGADIVSMFGVAVLTETVFNLNGIGSSVAKAAAAQDVPLVLGFVAPVVIVTSIVFLLVDIAYAWLDPRVRLQ